MVSKSHHIMALHQFQLVTEHSLKGATNYGNRAPGLGNKHDVLRPRPRPGSSGLETKNWITSGLETETWTKWTRVHTSLDRLEITTLHKARISQLPLLAAKYLLPFTFTFIFFIFYLSFFPYSKTGCHLWYLLSDCLFVSFVSELNRAYRSTALTHHCYKRMTEETDVVIKCYEKH